MMLPEKAAEILYHLMDDANIIRSITVDGVLKEKIDPDIIEACKVLNYSITANGVLYKNEDRGFLPEIMERMYNDRSNYKKQQLDLLRQAEKAKTEKEKEALKEEAGRYKSAQEALKVCLNSAYGAAGSEYFVLYDIRLAEAITRSGQLAIQWVGKDINKFLNKVTGKTDMNFIIAQDTDSMYLCLDELVKKVFDGKTPTITEVIDFLDKSCEQVIQPQINQSFERLKTYTNAYEQKMIMKRETLASVGVWKKKKRYFLYAYDVEGTRYKKPQLKVTGLESVRSTCPATARKAFEICYKMIAENKQDKMQKFIARIKRNWHKADLKRISFSTGVNGLETYAGTDAIWGFKTPEHVKAALIYNHHLKRLNLDKKYQLIKNGNKIRYVYLKEPNNLGNDVIAWETRLPEEFDIKRFIDYNACYEKAFEKPMKELLDTFGWHLQKTWTLDDVFG